MRVCVILAASLFFGCGDNLAVAPDAAPPDGPPAFAEAMHDTPPTVVSGGGPVLTSPKVQPIFFMNDSDMQMSVEQFLTTLDSSQYWTTTTSEYGVGAITHLPTIISTDAVPANDMDLQTWLANNMDGTHTADGWPATPDPSVIYTVFIPSGVSFGSACTSYGGYHDEGTSTQTTGKFTYALIPRCQAQAGGTAVDTLTSALSHELIESATDPLPDGMSQAYVQIDPEHYIWSRTPGAEIGDMCEYNQNADQPLVGSFTVQRTWSNLSAAAGHDPCVPVLGTPYLGVAPVFPEDIMVSTHGGGQMITTKGVTIALDTSKTLEVDLFSDAPTTADFTVAAYDSAELLQSGQATLAFQWDKTTGHNGDKLHVMITRTRAPTGTRGSEIVFVVQVAGQIVSMWWGYVA